LHEVDAGGRVGPAKALSGGVGKAFGGALGGFGGGEEKKPADAGIDSLVLEVSVREPGVQERVHRRTVYTSAKPEDGVAPFPILQDRPGICAETSQIALDDANGRVLLRRGIDIMENAARFEDGPLTLKYGLAETVLECLLVTRRWPGDAAPSAWTAMERARLQG